MLPDRKYLNYDFKNLNVNGDKCFDTQEKSVPRNKVQKKHNRVQKHTNRKHNQN
jgi:hypothetical protein